MPLWRPKTDKIGELIKQEELRIEDAQTTLRWTPSDISPPINWGLNTIEAPVKEVPVYAPKKSEPFSFSDVVPTFEPPETQVSSPKPTEKIEPEEVEQEIPLWMRALQVFGAPFEWIDEYIIKPGLGLAGTALGIPEAERQEGEDFWEWKKRSWEEWDVPTLISIPVPWAEDGKWDIDFKGVAEFAPWLLIPGAGQVGRGVKTASGIAGVLGRTGGLGKVAGYALEYSPWGLVEKGTGAAIRTIGKPIAKVLGKKGDDLAKSVFGEYTPPPQSPAVQKFTKVWNEEVIPQFKAFKNIGEKQLRGRQQAAARDIMARWRAGKITTIEEMKAAQAMLGGGEKQFYKTATKFTKKEAREIIAPIEQHLEEGLVQMDFVESMYKLLLGQELLPPRHLRTVARIYGGDFAKSLSDIGLVGKARFDKALDALNMPRAVLASGDLSGTARQGLILGLTHPSQIPKSFGRQLKAFFSEKLALETDDVLRADPDFADFIRHGGYFAPLTEKAGNLAIREESFMSGLAEKIPFVRRSERAFITYLNSLRLGAYKSASKAYKAAGATDKELKNLARFINLASGRGDLPKDLNKYAPALNALLFSSRLQMSRLQLPRQLGRMLLSGNPYERKEAATALVTFLGGGASLMGLLNASGIATTSLDPRSADFGKLVIGDTRLDIWTGYLQYMRFAAQLLSGERKSSYGNLNKADRSEIAFRFLQSKSSPAFGLLVDLLKGENYMGEPIFNETTGFIKTARNRLVPLAVQDIMDAMEQDGVNGLWTAPPAMLGIGTLTYVNDYVRVQEKIANDMGYDSWDDIDPKTQLEIRNNNTELQTAQLELDRRVMDTAWGQWRTAGNAIENVFQEDVEKAVMQYRQTGDGVQFRGKVSDAFMKRRGGYAARESDERFAEIVRRQQSEDPAELLITLGPEQLAIKSYMDALYGDDMYDEFGDYRFDEADIRKQALREQLGDEMYNYVEEYMGEKYALLPPEFHELAEAKKILKPYWDVRARVEKLYGKAFADSPAGQRLIAKLRKAKKASDIEMQRAYAKFYSK